MVQTDSPYIGAMERLLRKTDYFFFIKAVRGVGDFIDPWYLFDVMKQRILGSSSACKKTLLLLQMGYGADFSELAREVGEEDVKLLIEAGIWRREGERVETNNYIVLTYQGLALLTEINPWYETCTHPKMDVYIGSDSLRLAENIVFRRGTTVLDLCSGTGIQGLLAAKSAERVISVEMNEAAIPVTEFNIRLNHLEDIVELRRGNLYDVLEPEERFDFIYANPPFIPMVEGVEYPLCGAGGEDGRLVLDAILEGLPRFLKPGGETILFCECLGDRESVFFDEALEDLLRQQDWRGLCFRCGRIGTELQIERLAGLAALFDKNLDAADFRRRMAEVYRRLGATFLYHLVYKIDAEAGTGGALAYIDQCSPWTEEDRADVQDSFSLGNNAKTVGLFRSGRQVGAISRDAADVLELLREGHTVGSAADILYERCQKEAGRRRESRAGLGDRIIKICRNLEGLGAILRAGGN